MMSILKSHLCRILLGAVVLAMMLPLAQGGELYLLSGFPTAKFPWGFPSSLYRVDHDAAALVPVRDIVDRESGTNLIQVDHDHRIIVLGTPYLTPEYFEWIDMNAPAVTHSYKILYPGYSVIYAGFLEIPERGFYHAMYLSHGRSQRLVGMKLSRDMPPAEGAVELSLKYWKYAREDGRPLNLLGTRVNLGAKRDDGVLRPLGKQMSSETLGDVRLARVAGFTDGEKLPVLVNTDDFLVLLRMSERFPDLNGFGYCFVRVYLKKSHQWRKWKLPGAHSWVRAFGPWLTSTAGERGHSKDSPGNQERRVAILTKFFSVDDLFRYDGRYCPGILTVYHPETGRTFTIRTEQGDSEVILVANDTVYYRVNQSLYAAKIGRTELGSPKLLVRDPRVSFVHWAFLGPKAAE